MRMERVLMVEPRLASIAGSAPSALRGLSLPGLATIAFQKGFPVMVDFGEPLRFEAQRLDRADLLCLSVLTPTAPSGYAVADRARALGVPVVVGGAHATALPEEALQHADWVLRGPADRSFVQLLQVLAQDGDLATVPGLSYRQAGEIRHNLTDNLSVDLDSLPIVDPGVVVGGAAQLFRRGLLTMVTSRGSRRRRGWAGGEQADPWGSQWAFASPEKVAEELERRRGLGHRLFFLDEDFCLSPARTKELLEHLLTQGSFLPPWVAHVSPDAASDAELLRLMRRAGCQAVQVAFDPVGAALPARGLWQRDRTEEIRWTVQQFRQAEIRVRGVFLWGSDLEGVASLRQTTELAISEDFDSVQFLLLTPFPGTRLFRQLERQGRLLTRDWSRYDAHHVVFQPALMSSVELGEETFQAWRRAYSLRRTTRWLVGGDFQRAALSLATGGQARIWRRQDQELLTAS